MEIIYRYLLIGGGVAYLIFTAWWLNRDSCKNRRYVTEKNTKFVEDIVEKVLERHKKDK